MASHVPLARDATLRTVVESLDDQEQFVAGAFAVIHRHEREHGPVVLRIGVSAGSKGRRPNYRIDHAETGGLITVIDGNNHKPWTVDHISLSDDWSGGRMTHAQVADLLIEVRSRVRPKRSTG